MKPDSVNIHGIVYSIEYVDKPSDVDIHGRETLWGQIDYWTRTIRVYAKDRPNQDVWRTIMHEVLHGICGQMNLDELNKDENAIDLLALSLIDTFFRNNWLSKEILTDE